MHPNQSGDTAQSSLAAALPLGLGELLLADLPELSMLLGAEGLLHKEIRVTFTSPADQPLPFAAEFIVSGFPGANLLAAEATIARAQERTRGRITLAHPQLVRDLAQDAAAVVRALHRAGATGFVPCRDAPGFVLPPGFHCPLGLGLEAIQEEALPGTLAELLGRAAPPEQIVLLAPPGRTPSPTAAEVLRALAALRLCLRQTEVHGDFFALGPKLSQVGVEFGLSGLRLPAALPKDSPDWFGPNEIEDLLAGAGKKAILG